MTKQDAIKNAYGEGFKYLIKNIGEDGWSSSILGSLESICDKKTIDEDTYWRPKSLAGIENNNGWIKIESEKDLPKEEGEYYCKTTFTSYDEEYKTYSYPNFKFSIEVNNGWWLKYVTHYQPIIKPKPPIY